MLVSRRSVARVACLAAGLVVFITTGASATGATGPGQVCSTGDATVANLEAAVASPQGAALPALPCAAPAMPPAVRETAPAPVAQPAVRTPVAAPKPAAAPPARAAAAPKPVLRKPLAVASQAAPTASPDVVRAPTFSTGVVVSEVYGGGGNSGAQITHGSSNSSTVGTRL